MIQIDIQFCGEIQYGNVVVIYESNKNKWIKFPLGGTSTDDMAKFMKQVIAWCLIMTVQKYLWGRLKVIKWINFRKIGLNRYFFN